MSKRLEVKGRLKALGEIRNILSAMKNLATIEMSKVGRYLEAQQRCAEAAETALADFEGSFGDPLAGQSFGTEPVWVLVGSERGFCGAFNESLLGWFRQMEGEQDAVRLWVVGRKLALKLEGHPRLAGWLEGPDTAEEVPDVIVSLAGRLAERPTGNLRVVFHDGFEAMDPPTVLYPFEGPEGVSTPTFPYPPLTQLSSTDLYRRLLEQRLLFQLLRAFQASFMAENRQRLQHMEGAIQSLEKKLDRLHLKFNSLRQEEITEELEMILLGAEGVA
jgi:F-type H+-transporting ATPase subunit gamma